jgi:hypothetical protein
MKSLGRPSIGLPWINLIGRPGHSDEFFGASSLIFPPPVVHWRRLSVGFDSRQPISPARGKHEENQCIAEGSDVFLQIAGRRNIVTIKSHGSSSSSMPSDPYRRSRIVRALP